MNFEFVCRPVNWHEIEVGSTEQFQGQEKKIIIISTVRSQVELIKEDFQFNLGFLSNPKRYLLPFQNFASKLCLINWPNVSSFIIS